MVGDEYCIWAVFPREFDRFSLSPSPTTSIGLEEQYRTHVLPERQGDVIIDTADPRLRSFSRRLILPQGIKGEVY